MRLFLVLAPLLLSSVAWSSEESLSVPFITTPDEVVHRDEHLFQTVHQSSELWLKLACVEFERATELIDADAIAAAIRLLRRANDCLELLIGQLHMLEHISPGDYALVPGPGSGRAGASSLAASAARRPCFSACTKTSACWRPVRRRYGSLSRLPATRGIRDEALVPPALALAAHLWAGCRPCSLRRDW